MFIIITAISSPLRRISGFIIIVVVNDFLFRRWS